MANEHRTGEDQFRLVYQVQEQTITLRVIAVGKRERLAVYHAAARRLG